jgi:simple sugar transport system permease protein
MAWEILFSEAFIIALLSAGVRLATPILLTSLGEIFTQRSGILNLGLEGMMLIGCFSTFLVAYYTNNVLLALLAGALAGAVIAFVHAVVCISARANQTVSGIALNFVALGLAGFFFRLRLGIQLTPPTVEGLDTLKIPLLGDIPFIGPILFDQNVIVYFTFILVPIYWWFLFKTTYGLKIKAVGENPKAADTLGINVFRVRYACVIFGGLMAGLGGASLALGQRGQTFMEYMVAGRGWMALVLVMFSKWNPARALAGALLFGITDALQLRVQALDIGIPYHFLLMLPYAVTLIVLIGVSRKAERPAAMGVPYKRE